MVSDHTPPFMLSVVSSRVSGGLSLGLYNFTILYCQCFAVWDVKDTRLCVYACLRLSASGQRPFDLVYVEDLELPGHLDVVV